MMVPSTGTGTDLYASSTADCMALAKAWVSASITPCSPLAKPAKMRERMTPELPRAPSSMPDEAAEDSSDSVPMLSFRAAQPALSVISMLSPVSPSGMGNTLRSLTTFLSRPSCTAPWRSIAAKVRLSSSLVFFIVFLFHHALLVPRPFHQLPEGKRLERIGNHDG